MSKGDIGITRVGSRIRKAAQPGQKEQQWEQKRPEPPGKQD
jgi:hypothetical protein